MRIADAAFLLMQRAKIEFNPAYKAVHRAWRGGKIKGTKITQRLILLQTESVNEFIEGEKNY